MYIKGWKRMAPKKASGDVKTVAKQVTQNPNLEQCGEL
jgi:hypothetical protein